MSLVRIAFCQSDFTQVLVVSTLTSPLVRRLEIDIIIFVSLSGQIYRDTHVEAWNFQLVLASFQASHMWRACCNFLSRSSPAPLPPRLPLLSLSLSVSYRGSILLCIDNIDDLRSVRSCYVESIVMIRTLYDLQARITCMNTHAYDRVSLGTYLYEFRAYVHLHSGAWYVCNVHIYVCIRVKERTRRDEKNYEMTSPCPVS